jgi:phytoene synthase
MSQADFHSVLAKHDPDRRLSALFAPEAVRQRLMALYAFNYEISRIGDATSESLIAEMKLTWWRDAIEDLYAQPPIIRRHDVTEALAALTAHLDKADLLSLIDARFDDVGARPFANFDEVLNYVDQTAGQIVRLALTLCEVEASHEQVLEAGRAWGLTGLLRAFPQRAGIGRAPIGLDALEKLGASPAMLAQGLGEEKVAAALVPVRTVALQAAIAFKAHAPLSPDLMPALGYVHLVPGYLRRLPSKPFQMSQEQNMLARQFRMLWVSLTGR